MLERVLYVSGKYEGCVGMWNLKLLALALAPTFANANKRSQFDVVLNM
jgi:hypothetical protein